MLRFGVTILCALATTSAGLQTRKAPAAPQAKAPAAAPAPKREMAVPYKAGEVLEFDIGWSSYVTAGTATATVKEKKPSYNSVAYYVVAEGQPTSLLSKLYTLYYKADTLIDIYSLLPQRGSLYVREGKRQRMKTTTFNQAARKAKYEVQTATHMEKELALPGYTQDALSALYVLRSISMKAGDKFNMPVTDAGDIYKVQMQVTALESLKTPLGTMNALKIIPVITMAKGEPPRGLAIWISDDARRLPLKIEAQLAVGKFVVSLRKVAG
jgi:Protein of unknown function (DUF3108)